MLVKLVTILVLILRIAAQEDIVFDASVTHKFLFTDKSGSLVGGYQGGQDLPELQDKCNPWVGMFANFTVDFETTGHTDYRMSGSHIKVCFSSISEQSFGGATELYVTDYLTDVVWPESAQGFTPEVTNTSFYNSPNGFVANFFEYNNVWCLVGGFNKFIRKYDDQKQFNFSIAIMINDYTTCQSEAETIVIFNAANSLGTPQIIFTHDDPSDNDDGTSWWLWILGIIVVGLLGVGGYMYYKSSGDTGGF